MESGAGPQMTVKEVTPQGYVICTWTDPNTRQLKEGMFFAEMLQEEDAAETVCKWDNER
jgi:uncharacterized protein YodC (DUF2158 family)